MIFLISLLFAVCFSCLTAGILKKHPAPFYLAAAVLSAGAVYAAQNRPDVPAWVTEYLLHPLTKGILATAFWAVVMWLGAIPDAWKAARKRLMPVRGQLSIFAAILTLGHMVGFGISYLPRWAKRGEWLNFTVCIVLAAVMLPLTVLSVKKIRSKIKGKRWKQIQRLAYLFYVFIPVHVFLLNYSRAKRGRDGAFFSLMVYAAVFGGWAVCRLLKWYHTAKKPAHRLLPNTAAALLFSGMIAGTAAAAHSEKGTQRNPGVQDVIVEVIAPPETEAAATTSVTETTVSEATETTVTSETDGTDSDTTTTGTETTAEISTDETLPQDVQSSTEAAPAVTPAETVPTTQTTAAPVTTTPAPVYKYRSGSYQVSAMGYDGMIYLTITIQNDVITEISGYTDEEDDSYFLDAKKRMIPAILSAQSADVDGVSGATYSSDAIRQCVRKVLEAAANG
ncbi:MAG: FMN-binding protein [Oscillospiraceae bacterium]|nr:FMN-binding protein [Oscillospiraceae bacterium]